MILPETIHLGDTPVKVVTLHTAQEQADGFQHYKEIPREYGLLFPNAGEHWFHMQNVGSELLMVALNRDGKVVAKEIRAPETPGKQVGRGAGLHILELHPDYDSAITVGSHLSGVEKARKTAGFVGGPRKGEYQSMVRKYWMAPSGRLRQVSEHTDLISEILGNSPSKAKWTGNYADAYRKGWLRIVMDADSIVVNGNPQGKQVKALEDEATERGLYLHLESFQRVAQGNPTYDDWSPNGEPPRSFWLDRSGKVHGSTFHEDHAEMARRTLGISTNDECKHPEGIYGAMEQQGWVRGIRYGKEITIELHTTLTPAQTKRLREMADQIEGSIEVDDGRESTRTIYKASRREAQTNWIGWLTPDLQLLKGTDPIALAESHHLGDMDTLSAFDHNADQVNTNYRNYEDAAQTAEGDYLESVRAQGNVQVTSSGGRLEYDEEAASPQQLKFLKDYTSGGVDLEAGGSQVPSGTRFDDSPDFGTITLPIPGTGPRVALRTAGEILDPKWLHIKDRDGNTYEITPMGVGGPQKGRIQYLLTNVEGKTVGNLVVGYVGDGLHPYGVSIEPDYQRKGLATALYDAVERYTGKKILESGARSPEGQKFRKNYDLLSSRLQRNELARRTAGEAGGSQWMSGFAFPDGQIFYSTNPKDHHIDVLFQNLKAFLGYVPDLPQDKATLRDLYYNPKTDRDFTILNELEEAKIEPFSVDEANVWWTGEPTPQQKADVEKKFGKESFNAFERKAQKKKRQPIVLGIIDYNGAVHAKEVLSGETSHAAEFGGRAYKRWRYVDGYVTWMDASSLGQVDEEDKTAVENWLARKGLPFKVHDSFLDLLRRKAAFHNPNGNEAFKDRLGRCYELAGRFVAHNDNTQLVHGSIQGFRKPRIGHAWVEIGNGDIWEPSTNREWSHEAFDGLFNPQVDAKYSHEEVCKLILRHQHWGPWDELSDRKGQLSERKGWDSTKHPRGQPGHPSEFKSTGKATQRTPKRVKAPRTPKPGCDERCQRARAAHVMVDSEIQRYAEEHNEPQIAKALGGQSFNDSEPVDIVVHNADGSVKYGVELKTIVKSANSKITMKADAMKRKRKWERQNKSPIYTLVVDDTNVFNANGKGKHDFSKRRLYFAAGFGSFRLSTMYPCKDITEVKNLVDTPYRNLPPAVKKR